MDRAVAQVPLGEERTSPPVSKLDKNRKLGMGIGDTKLTYATGLNYGLENEKPFAVDFTFWYQRDHLLDHAEAPALIFGEAKSFAVGSFEAKDITRMRRLAEKFPGGYLVFAMLKDTLTEPEKAEIAALATWGRELLDDGPNMATTPWLLANLGD